MRARRYDVRATPRTTSFAEGARRCRPLAETDAPKITGFRIVVVGTADFRTLAFITADFTTADFTTADFTTADFTAAFVETADLTTADFNATDFLATALEAASLSARDGKTSGDCEVATRGGIFSYPFTKEGLRDRVGPAGPGLDRVRSRLAGGCPDGLP